MTVESDYDLEQDEFYSDLYVVKRPHVEENNEEHASSSLLSQEEGIDSLDSNIDNAKSVLVDNNEVSA